MQRTAQIEQLVNKLHSLSLSERREVGNFVDFLLSKKQQTKTVQSANRLRSDTMKKILLNISVWNEKDIAEIHKATKEINKWKIKTL
jgi:hypothetical protein